MSTGKQVDSLSANQTIDLGGYTKTPSESRLCIVLRSLLAFLAKNTYEFTKKRVLRWLKLSGCIFNLGISSVLGISVSFILLRWQAFQWKKAK